MNTPGTSPTVQSSHRFKKDEKLECKSTGETFKVIAVTKVGYACEGRAGIMPFAAARKPLTEEERKALAAEKEDEG